MKTETQNENSEKMTTNDLKIELTVVLEGRVKVVTISPVWSYFGVVIGKDESMVYLDTGDYQGVIALPLTNICNIVKADKKGDG